MGSECHRIDQDSSQEEEAACTQDASGRSSESECGLAALMDLDLDDHARTLAPHLEDFCEHIIVASLIRRWTEGSIC